MWDAAHHQGHPRGSKRYQVPVLVYHQIAREVVNARKKGVLLATPYLTKLQKKPQQIIPNL